MLNQQKQRPNETERAMRICGYQNFVWLYLFIIAAHPGSVEYHSVDVTYPQQNIYTSLKKRQMREAGPLPAASRLSSPLPGPGSPEVRAQAWVVPADTGKNN